MIKLGTLHPTRDFNYVKDTVEGFIKVAEADQAIGEVINIGSNYEVSIGETARLIAELMEAEITIVTEDKRVRPAKSEVERLWADNSKAKRLLNWTPQYGGLDGLKRGLAETIAWFSDPKNLQHYKAGMYNI